MGLTLPKSSWVFSTSEVARLGPSSSFSRCHLGPSMGSSGRTGRRTPTQLFQSLGPWNSRHERSDTQIPATEVMDQRLSTTTGGPAKCWGHRGQITHWPSSIDSGYHLPIIGWSNPVEMKAKLVGSIAASLPVHISTWLPLLPLYAEWNRLHFVISCK